MSKIRTKEELDNFIDKNIKWRRLEIHNLKKELEDASKKGNQQLVDVLKKSVIVISYSHWEGFIKETSRAYIKYLKHISLKTKQVIPDLVYAHIAWSISTKKITDSISFIKECLENPDYPLTYNLNEDTISSTESNLNSEVLEKIITSLGMDYNLFVLKKAFIDEKLLSNRNAIAHGNNYYGSSSDVLAIASEVITLLDLYRNTLQNHYNSDRFRNSESV